MSMLIRPDPSGVCSSWQVSVFSGRTGKCGLPPFDAEDLVDQPQSQLAAPSKSKHLLFDLSSLAIQVAGRFFILSRLGPNGRNTVEGVRSRNGSMATPSQSPKLVYTILGTGRAAEKVIWPPLGIRRPVQSQVVQLAFGIQQHHNIATPLFHDIKTNNDSMATMSH
jgi:hypothetical protein